METPGVYQPASSGSPQDDGSSPLEGKKDKGRGNLSSFRKSVAVPELSATVELDAEDQHDLISGLLTAREHLDRVLYSLSDLGARRSDVYLELRVMHARLEKLPSELLPPIKLENTPARRRSILSGQVADVDAEDDGDKAPGPE
jgi:hypothetical protein